VELSTCISQPLEDHKSCDISEKLVTALSFKPIVLKLALQNQKPTLEPRFEWKDDKRGACWNYAQRFKKEWRISERDEGQIRRLQIRAYEAERFAERLEMAFLFGKREMDKDNYPFPFHYMNGIYNSIQTNRMKVRGEITEKKWVSFLEKKAFTSGSKEKIMLYSSDNINILRKWSKFFDDLSEDIMGIGADPYYVGNDCKLYLYQHPFLNRESMSGIGLIIDPAEIGCRYMEYHEASIGLTENGKPHYCETWNGSNVYQYFAEIGLELRNEKNHAVIEVA
jgi:hypothetical protein